MRTFPRLLGAAMLAVLLLAGIPARADIFDNPLGRGIGQDFGLAGCASIHTHNATDVWMWVTIYDLGKTQHLDYGWVAPRQDREWRSGGYACAGVYYVRAQVKNNRTNQPVDGPDIYDTTVQVSGTSHDWYLHSDQVKVHIGGFDCCAIWTTDKSFYWSRDLAPNSTAALPVLEEPTLTVVNGSPQAMYVAMSTPPMIDPRTGARCIPPGAQEAFRPSDVGMRLLSITGPTASCGVTPDFTHPVVMPWTFDYSGKRVVLRPGLAPTGSPIPGKNGYTFANASPYTVKFVVDGAPATQVPCVAPGASSPPAQLPATLPLGPRKVTSYVVARCNDPNDNGTKLATDTLNMAPFFELDYTLRWGFFPN